VPQLARLTVCSALWCSCASMMAMAESARPPGAHPSHFPSLWSPAVASPLVSGEPSPRDRAVPPRLGTGPCR
jgi:hypothetical protein